MRLRTLHIPGLVLSYTPSPSLYIFHLKDLFIYIHAVPMELEDGAPEGISDGCELPYGCWESNPSLLQEHTVLLTAERSLKPSRSIFSLSLSFFLVEES